MAEKRDMSGALFINDRKEKDTHPDRSGYIVVNGVEFWLSGWLKEKDGKPWMSLAVKPKDAGTRETPMGKALDSGIPF
jgi:hypothetical protein